MSRCVQALDRRFYPESGTNWDDDLFRSAVLERSGEQTAMLDLGAGAGIVEQMNFRDLVRQVCGIDLDSRVLDNPYLDEARIAGGEQIPFGDAEFDIVISDNVLEHLDAPVAVFREIARVLKPGGHFLFKTPNTWHYMPLIARFTPHRFHGFVNRLRGRKTVDTFPTRYRANSVRRIHRLADLTGLQVTNIRLIEGRPEYTRIFCPLYLAGIAYERLVNRFQGLSRFRILMIGELRKPA